MTTPQDSPIGWIADHIRRYEESDGADGHWWRGVPTCLLTTTGRKSGVPRRTALIYGRDGDGVVIVASMGGSDSEPQWLKNLAVSPRAHVTVGSESFDATARVAEGHERAALWEQMVSIFPRYAEYQTRTDRQFAVVILTPGAGPRPSAAQPAG
jgi:deazaflavin-dependent oxidoreductase (nitroreductase family)